MLVPLVIGVALVAAFVVRALHIENPLLDMRLYANKAFAAASVTMFALGAALFGAMVLMPLYFQTVRGEDAVATGLLLAPAGHRRGVRDGPLRPRDRALRRRPHRAHRRRDHCSSRRCRSC